MRILHRVCASALVAAVSIGVMGACSSKEKNAAADVTVAQCQTDASGGKPSAQGDISNNSSKASGYAFSVVFVDAAGNKVSEGPVAVAKVEPGGSAKWNVTGLAGAKGPVTCKINNVVRTAVP